MSGLEALQSVQFVTWEGRRLAVIDGGDWDALVEWLENIEDVQAARQAYQVLKEAGGDRDKAGWLRWDEVESCSSMSCAAFALTAGESSMQSTKRTQ